MISDLNIQQLITHVGGPRRFSSLTGISYHTVASWSCGRKSPGARFLGILRLALGGDLSESENRVLESLRIIVAALRKGNRK